VIVGQVGVAGSCELGDFVVLGGQVAVADHAKIGDGARLAGRSAATPGSEFPGGQDYGGVPAIPIREWRRQMAAVAMLGRRRSRE
jgi:UDP-3-O-[3-hydroxymyristoyl] glucosamine N-acyltransferase